MNYCNSVPLIQNVSYRVCVDEKKDNDFSGRIFNAYSAEPIVFFSGLNMLFRIEEKMDELHYPHRAIAWRSFQEVTENPKQVEVKKYMSEKEFENESGKKSTFIVEVKYRENATWQGRVRWVEENKDLNFRSALELLKIIDTAVTEEK